MIMSLDEAARIGASRGLLGEGEPADIGSWPAAVREAFHHEYGRGRRTRNIAEGKTTLATPADLTRFAGMSREALAREYAARLELRAEFGDVAAFVAYALAEQAGRARIMRGRVVF